MVELRNRCALSFAAAVVLLFVFFTQAALSEGDGEEKSYGWFFTRSKHINQLLQAGEIGKASDVWNREADYFRHSRKSEDRKCTEDLAEALEESLAGRAQEEESRLLSVKWPEPQYRWRATKLAIAAADEFIEEVSSHQVLVHSGRVDRITQGVVSTKESLVSAVKSGASEAFVAYKGRPRRFFTEYPIKVEPAEFLETNKPMWLKALSNATCDDIQKFVSDFPGILGAETLGGLGEIFFKKALALQSSGKATLPQMLAAQRMTKEAGLPLPKEANQNIQLITVKNSSGAKEDAIEFPVDVDVDVPMIGAPRSVEKTGLDTALSGAPPSGADILILFNATKARTDRKLKAPEEVTSKYQSGTRRVPNPEYSRQLADLRRIEMVIQLIQQNARTNQLTCSGFSCLGATIADAALMKRAMAAYGQAEANLNATPLTLEEPVYTSYEFNRTVIDAAKVAAIDYYMIDRGAQTYLKGTFNAREERSFTVCYGLRGDDPDRNRHLAACEEEEDVVRFEQSPVTAPLSKILEGAEQIKAGPVPTMASLRSEILANSESASKAAQKKKYTAAIPQDTRFDSVVVVLSPAGTLGSGFFVKDDVVLTNVHVVEGSKLAKMKLHDGSETSGRVIAQDIRLDLALVKVQAQGIPVRMYKEQSLMLGAQVEAIGHPAGLQFSITKGVVSGIRELPSRHAPGGKNVRFIQTDTAINPGNSGGPLYLGDRVIGVNTWKVVAEEIGGLNFAVHYGEVLEFLEANGIVPPG